MSVTTNPLTKRRMVIGSHAVDVHSNDANSHCQTIVFVHGIGVSSNYFQPFANELAKNYHVVVIDLPGYGKTPKPDHALSIVELANFVIMATEQLQVGGSIILGHSMGCQIVAHAVKKQPQLYEKMVLLAPTVYRHERSLFMQTVRLLQDTMFEPIKASLVIFPDYVRMGLGRYLATCRYMLEDRIEETLLDCIIPALIVRGVKDKIVPGEWVRYLDQVTPNSMLRHVNNAPHAVQLSQPMTLARMCSDFIEG